jgi:hypothetical protein
MVAKLGAQFGKDFESYKNPEDGQSKSEAGLMDFLRRQDAALSVAELKKGSEATSMIRS